MLHYSGMVYCHGCDLSYADLATYDVVSCKCIEGGSQSVTVVINAVVTWGSQMAVCFVLLSSGAGVLPTALLEGLLLCTVWQLGFCSCHLGCPQFSWLLTLNAWLGFHYGDWCSYCGSEHLSAGALITIAALHVAHLIGCKCWSYNRAGCSWAVTSVTQ
jgi:hypothetical protein